MSVIGVVIAIVIVGFALACAQKVPMDPTIAWFIRAVAILFLFLIIMSWLTGWMPPGGWGFRN